MKIGFIGLGKMGGNMTLRLVPGSPDGSIPGGHEVVGYARDPNPALQGVRGITLSPSVEELVRALPTPRAVWVMVPAGDPTENVVGRLAELLKSGDLIIDGGNSHYKDSMRRAEGLSKRGIGFLDVGTSGGIWGREEGYCLMIGGDAKHVELVRPIFETLAPPNGWAHVGASGAGHLAKICHNACEYGLMEAYGEAFELLRKSNFQFDLHQIAALWNRGSVVRSWLLELADQMLKVESDLRTIQPYVEDSGEGRWAVAAAMEHAVAVPVIAASLFARFESRDKENFSARFCAALRKQFGGHDVVRKDVTEKAEERHIEHSGQTK